VSSARGLTAEGDRREMVSSLLGREPGSRGTSTVESRCQATLMKTAKSSLLRQRVRMQWVWRQEVLGLD
jgi:hypothetical protein